MDYRILVVEDEPDINNLLARILREEDYKVLQAFSGTEAQMVTGSDAAGDVRGGISPGSEGASEFSCSGDRNLRQGAAGG